MAQTFNFEKGADRRQHMCVSRPGKGCGFTDLSALCVRSEDSASKNERKED